MLGATLDIFRLRQYFDALTRARELFGDLGHDVRFLAAAARAVAPVPLDGDRAVGADPFPPFDHDMLNVLPHRRVALAATGGSGALASVVGVARACEEAGVTPSALSLCSGSAMFGFPLAAGIPAGQVASFLLGLRPADYVDVNWRRLLLLGPSLARGFAGLLAGERLEQSFGRLVGEMRLGELPIPAYAPIWNVEENRVEYLGPRTYPDMKVARAIHMAVALPLFVDPVELDGGWWCDGGIVDIFPVKPLLDIEEPPDIVVAVNGFYPPEFAGESQRGWRDRRASILYEASQVRTCQHAALARENLARLREHAEVLMLEPVPYQKVRGLGFYEQFLDTREWGDFMVAGRDHARRAFEAADRRLGAVR